MYEVLRYGPAGSLGSPEEGPGTPDGPFGSDVNPGGGPVAPPTPAVAVGDVPLMDRVPTFDLARLVKQVNVAAEVHNSLVFWGILTLEPGQPQSRRWVIDPTKSPLSPGSGLTGTFNSGPFGSG